MSDIEQKVKKLPIPIQEWWYERSGIYMDNGMTQPEADKAAWDELCTTILKGETHGNG